jgi:hypothetical protein
MTRDDPPEARPAWPITHEKEHGNRPDGNHGTERNVVDQLPDGFCGG